MLIFHCCPSREIAFLHLIFKLFYNNVKISTCVIDYNYFTNMLFACKESVPRLWDYDQY